MSLPATDVMVPDAGIWFDAYAQLSTSDKVGGVGDTLDFTLTDEFLEDTEFAILVIDLERQARPMAIAPLSRKYATGFPRFITVRSRDGICLDGRVHYIVSPILRDQ